MIDIIVGTRPNFVKVAPLIEELKNNNITYRLIHTGQHYDNLMNDVFFKDLNIPKPDINFGINGGSQAYMTAKMMICYEELLKDNKPDLCVVLGDVTSTMACAIVAQKECIQVAHIEAGLRCGDWTMPEEINRIITDSITNYFFTTSKYANENLIKCGIPEERIFFVGNIMIDTLLKYQDKVIKPEIYDQLNIRKNKYVILTMHRPANVNNPQKLCFWLKEISEHCNDIPVIFPVHPRTYQNLNSRNFKNIVFTNPLGYLDFIYLVKNSMGVITDSGGITEETTVINIPCITLRDRTERPETCFIGTNELIENDIGSHFEKLFSGKWKQGKIPYLWDGHTAQRIVKIIKKII